MTLTFNVSGTFTGTPVAYAPAVTAGLQAWHYFGGSDAAGITNQLEGGTAAAMVGAPVENASYAQFTGLSAYAQLGVAAGGNCTFLALMQASAAVVGNTTDVIGLGDSTASTSGQHLGFVYSGGAAVLRASRIVNPGTPTTVNASLALASPTSWNFVAATFANGGAVNVYNLTNWNLIAALTPGTGANTANLIESGVNLRAGSTLNTYSGVVNQAFAAVYNTVLSTGDMGSILAQVRNYTAGLSTPITGF